MKRRAMDQITGWIRVDSAGLILACNPASLRILGLKSEEQAREIDFWSLAADPEAREAVQTLIRENGKAENFEMAVSGQGDSTVTLLANVVANPDADGEGQHLDVYIIDISERRKLERQWGRAERMEALGTLACGVAHDFNNLLTAILCNAEFLENALGEDSAHKSVVREIQMAGEKGASLTRQLLTFAKGSVSEVATVDLNRVITDMRPLLSQLVGGRVELTLDLARDLKPIRVDKSRLEQVILNLAINARDAMDGQGELTVRTANHRVEQPFVLHHDRVLPGGYTMLEVQDTGTGIEPQIMEHLFEPFFTTKEGTGTGLGLSTVYGVVKQHGGFISVYNEAEGGVTFKASFPSLEAVESAQPKARAQAAARDREARTILIAEDDAGVRQLVEKELRAHGFAVLSAKDGQEAIELAESCHDGIRLLLSDVSMPKMNGVELARRFSSLRPGVPILLFSGTAKEDVLLVGLEGSIGFLEKPFTAARLFEKIETLL